MTAEPFPTNQPPWALTAGLALGASIGDDRDLQRRTLQFIHDNFGAAVFPQVMLAWVDAVIDEAFPDKRGKPVTLEFKHELALHPTGADAVHPSIAWAGRFVAARVADDEAMAKALIQSVSSDEEWAMCVSAVLHCCGAVLRQHRTQQVPGGG